MERKRGRGKRLNENKRLEIIRKLQRRDAPSKRAIAREYNVAESSIRNLWKKRESVINRSENLTPSIRDNIFRFSSPQFPELEKRLYLWMHTMRCNKIEIPPSLVKIKALELARTMNIDEMEFKGSWGWLRKFRTRYGLHSRLLHGEGAEVNKNDPVLLSALNDLYDIIKKYPPDCIYNMDETGLFFRHLPKYTLLMPYENVTAVRGKKKSKEKVTLVVCANADGSNKMPCCMIGKSKQPASAAGKEWPIPYMQQPSAWMDAVTYHKWFHEIFLPAVRKRTEQPVLLLLDNAPGHFVTKLETNNIRVAFFPPNCTSWKQPCDQGIINALKKRYKYLYLKDVLHFYELPDDQKSLLMAQASTLKSGSAGVAYGNPAHLMDVAKYVKEAWAAITPIRIENCFRKAELSIHKVIALPRKVLYPFRTDLLRCINVDKVADFFISK